MDSALKISSSRETSFVLSDPPNFVGMEKKIPDIATITYTGEVVFLRVLKKLEGPLFYSHTDTKT